MKTRTRIATTFASLAFLASTVVATGNAQPLSHLMHMHPGGPNPIDNRVSLRLYNQGERFEEVMVAGKSYTLQTHQLLSITAPTGTSVYAVTNVALHRRGDVVLTVAPEMQNQRIVLR